MGRRKNEPHMKYLFSEDIQYVRGRKQKQSHWKPVLLVVILLAFAAFSAGSFFYIDQEYRAQFGRAGRPDRTIYLTYEDVAAEYTRQEVTFPSDGNTLRGYIYGPQEAEALVVLSPALGSGADEYLADIVYFVRKGYKVFAFDGTGCYDSEGSSVRGLSQSLVDLDAALTWLERQEEYKGLPVLLYGYGTGGYAVCAVLGYEHDVAAAVSVAGYDSPMEMITTWCQNEFGPLVTKIETPYIWLYQKILFGGASNLSAARTINESQTPVLLIHGTRDEIVPYDEASILSHREEITNPKARFTTYSEAGRNGHTSMYFSQEALAYAAELGTSYMKMERTYGRQIPKEVLDEWYDQVDRGRASERDEIFMQDVYSFYQEVLEPDVE